MPAQVAGPDLATHCLLGACPLLAVLAGVPFPSQPLPHHLCPPHSKLRPPLDAEKKSRLLSVCLRSVLALPLLDILEKHTCLFLEPPNVQVRTGACTPSPGGALGQGAQLCLLLMPRKGAVLTEHLLRARPCGAPRAPRESMACTQGLCSSGLRGRVSCHFCGPVSEHAW